MADLLGTFPSIFDAPDIKLTLTVDIHSIEELDANYEAFLGEGFEGQMIRINSAPYQQKRTKWLLKRKEFIDAEYQITDIVEGTGNRSGMAGYAVLILNKTTTFKSAFKFPREKLREILRNADKYIAGDATVRYQNLTPRGVPRFPRITVLHPGGRKL
jgi:ATP-dependent DNA ligase